MVGKVSREALRNRVYEKLIDVARQKRTITYTEVGALAGLDVRDEDQRSVLSQILGLISTYEHQQGRPMLSAVVVHAEYGIPGPGFFQLARQLGLLRSKSRTEDPLFWHQELNKVFVTWRK